MAEWLYTNVLHEPRKALGISVLEYCVLDYIYKTQTHPIYGKNGWTNAGCHRVAAFFDLSSGTVKKLFDRMDKAGLLERVANDMKRATEKFYSIAYESDVQKVNDYRSQSEQQGVQKVNSNRSKSEQYNKKKVNTEYKLKEKQVVELHSTVTLLDEVDETSVEIHHVPEYFDIKQKKPKEKSGAKKEKVTSAEDLDLVYQVVTYLNEKTEQAFQPGGEKTKSLILARHHADKWSLEDFKTVIDHKKSEWFVKDNLRQYLRPSTLFAAGHAEEYLQAAKLWKKKPVATSPGVVPLFRQENFVNTDRSKFKF